MNYQELVSKRKSKVLEKICPACGEKFTPISPRGAGSSKVYCSRPSCERKRENERKKRARAKRVR